MASFFKGFLQDDAKRPNPATGREVFLGAFGKHPAWADFFEIGLSTPSLRMAWDRLYANGIGANGGPIIGEGEKHEHSWDDFERKNPGQLLTGFAHAFIWWRAGQFLAGRMWATSDHARPPREKYPLVVCFHALGVPLSWAVRNLLPRLEEAPAFCRVRNPAEIQAEVRQIWNSGAHGDDLRAQVHAGFDRLQQELRAAVAQAPPEGLSSALTPEERQQFIAAPEFGPEREGLLRVLYRLESQFPSYLGHKNLNKGDTFFLQPSQIRVPVAAPSVTEGMLRWIEFFSLVLAPDAPLLLTAPMDAGWIDVTAGEPAARQFFCLRALPQAIPVCSNLAYALDAGLRDKGARIIEAFLAGQRLSAEPKTGPELEPKSKGGLLHSATAFFRRGPDERASPKKPPGKVNFWVICGAILVLLVVAVLAVRPRTDTFSRAFNRALAAEKAKDYAMALAGYQAALKLKPGNGECASRIERMNQLLATTENDRQFNLAVEVARAAEKVKDYGKAQASYKTALNLRPGDAECSQKIELMKQLITAEERQKQHAAALAVARSAEEGKGYAAALSNYQAALELKPGDAECSQKIELMKQLITTEEKQKQYAAALAAARSEEEGKSYAAALSNYQAALELKPGDAECSQKIELMKQLIAVAEKEKQFAAALVAARAAFGAKKLDEAATRVQAALDLKPGDAEAIVLQAQIQGELRKLERYQKAMDLAWRAWSGTNSNQVISQAQAALKEKPGDAPTSNLVWQAQQRMKPMTSAGGSVGTVVGAQTGIMRTFTNSLSMEFVWIPGVPGGGAFVGKYEVTQKQFRDVMEKLPNGQQLAPGDDYPVGNVSFQDATQFCQRLSRVGERYTLPSKSEWLAAAALAPEDVANAWEILRDRGALQHEVTSLDVTPALAQPARVGSRGGQTNGLCDLFGNLREWVVGEGKEPAEIAGFCFYSKFGWSKDLFPGLQKPGLMRETGFRCILRGVYPAASAR